MIYVILGYFGVFTLGTVFGMSLCALMVSNQQDRWKERVLKTWQPKTGPHRPPEE